MPQQAPEKRLAVTQTSMDVAWCAATTCHTLRYGHKS